MLINELKEKNRSLQSSLAAQETQLLELRNENAALKKEKERLQLSYDVLRKKREEANLSSAATTTCLASSTSNPENDVDVLTEAMASNIRNSSMADRQMVRELSIS